MSRPLSAKTVVSLIDQCDRYSSVCTLIHVLTQLLYCGMELAVDQWLTLFDYPVPSNLWYKSHLKRQWNCWSLRCSWRIACQHCSNYIIRDLTPSFNGLGKDNCKTKWETFKFWYLVQVFVFAKFGWSLFKRKFTKYITCIHTSLSYYT